MKKRKKRRERCPECDNKGRIPMCPECCLGPREAEEILRAEDEANREDVAGQEFSGTSTNVRGTVAQKPR